MQPDPVVGTFVGSFITPTNRFMRGGIRTCFGGSTYQHAYHIAIKSLKIEDRPYKRSDGGGLFIQIQPNGARLWRFAYRFDGKQKLLSGGPYPQMSLLAARAWRDEMKQQLALGLDPSEGTTTGARGCRGASRQAGTEYLRAGRARMAGNPPAVVDASLCGAGDGPTGSRHIPGHRCARHRADHTTSGSGCDSQDGSAWSARNGAAGEKPL